MHVKSGYLNWMEGWHNATGIHLLMDENEMPAISDLRYEETKVNATTGVVFAEKDGFVDYFCYNSDKNGYGGRTFNLKMKDGTEKSLKGPWSSRAGVMNAKGFTPCVDVTIEVSRYRLYACAVTLDFLNSILHKLTFKNPFEFGKGVAPVVFPEGSKIVIGAYGCASGTNIDTLLFTGVSGDQISAISFDNGDVVYKPMIQFPDGTTWEKMTYINKEWEKKYPSKR